ncbi:MAG: type II/IV secretion system protein [Candidatus Pacebacteria bacterium]|nr:type II/IV secretion system protein [Candidatus Paceibacterota bacterium]
MKLSDEKLKELLVGPGHISEANFDLAVKDSNEQERDILNILVERDLIRDEQLGQLVAENLGFSFIDLKTEKIDEEVLRLIPELVARSKGVIVFSRGEEGVKVGMTDPSDSEIRHIIEKKVGQKVLPFYITKQSLKVALKFYDESIKEEFDKILKKLDSQSLNQEEQDETVVEMVDLLLKYSHQNKASDVHLEPYLEKVVVRFRIDGVMHKVLELPKNLHDKLLSRIKILAQIRTDEHRAAQDGKLRFETEEEVVDVRVSVVPIVEGENVVMRLLSAQSRRFGLDDLGLIRQNLKVVENAIKKPHGMILVTGPTGSGKSTTLYAVMTLLNNPNIHISTIEDPVEYDIEGISQIQVNTKTNLTFANGLRAIVRQDPDIIMVGEIRDQETAGIAVNSALTGHLVLSTLHTNNAAATIPRLMDMGCRTVLGSINYQYNNCSEVS